MIGENNDTKGDAPKQFGSAKAERTLGGGVDSLKPRICAIEFVVKVYGKNIVGKLTLEAGNKEAACNNSIWGSIGDSTGANVRAVGIWADMGANWGIEETKDWGERREGVMRTWTVEVTIYWEARENVGTR